MRNNPDVTLAVTPASREPSDSSADFISSAGMLDISPKFPGG